MGGSASTCNCGHCSQCLVMIVGTCFVNVHVYNEHALFIIISLHNNDKCVQITTCIYITPNIISLDYIGLLKCTLDVTPPVKHAPLTVWRTDLRE